MLKKAIVRQANFSNGVPRDFERLNSYLNSKWMLTHNAMGIHWV
jgi:hypothetical protein